MVCEVGGPSAANFSDVSMFPLGWPLLGDEELVDWMSKDLFSSPIHIFDSGWRNPADVVWSGTIFVCEQCGDISVT